MIDHPLKESKKLEIYGVASKSHKITNIAVYISPVSRHTLLINHSISHVYLKGAHTFHIFNLRLPRVIEAIG